MIELDTDVSTAIRTEQGKLVVQRTQDTTPYLDQNQREYNSAASWRPYGSGRKDQSLRKVASVPLIVIEQWMREGINVFDPSPETQKKITQKLNSNEYRYLRTAPGRIRTYRT